MSRRTVVALGAISALGVVATPVTVALWPSPPKKPRSVALPGHSYGITSVAFSPDGRTLATGSRDKTARLWDVATATGIATLTGHTGQISSVAFSPDGRTLATASLDGTTKLWDAATHAAVTTLASPGGHVYATAFSPDGRFLAVGGHDGDITLLNAHSYAQTTTLTRPDMRPTYADDSGGNEVNALGFSPDGTALAAYYADGETHLWDVAGARVTRTFEATASGTTASINQIAYSPDGRILAVCEPYGSAPGNNVQLWDTASGKLTATLAPREIVTTAAFSPDGRTLATGEGPATSTTGSTRLWDVPSGRVLTTFTGHRRPVTAVAFSPDGTHLATGAGDGGARLWKLV